MGNNQQATRLYQNGEHVVKLVTIQRNAEELYTAWIQLDDLSRFVDHVVRVEYVSPTESRWTVADSKGTSRQWTATTIRDEPGRRISWQSTPESEFANAGTVAFRDLPYGRGCEMTVTLEYVPPPGLVAMFTSSKENVSSALQRALWRFRNVMEAEEIPTIAEQARGKGDDAIDPAKPIDHDVRDIAGVTREGSIA